MNSDSNQPKQIFERAIEFGSAEEREEYLKQICGDDLALKAQVEDFLMHMAGLATSSKNLIRNYYRQ